MLLTRQFQCQLILLYSTFSMSITFTRIFTIHLKDPTHRTLSVFQDFLLEVITGHYRLQLIWLQLNLIHPQVTSCKRQLCSTFILVNQQPKNTSVSIRALYLKLQQSLLALFIQITLLCSLRCMSIQIFVIVQTLQFPHLSLVMIGPSYIALLWKRTWIYKSKVTGYFENP